MIPLIQLPALAWKYRRLIGYGLAVLAIFAIFLAYRHSLIKMGREQGRLEVRAEWDEAISFANREIAAKDAAYQALQSERDKVALEVQDLRNRPLPAPRTLIREVPTDAPVSTCPRLSPDFLREYNARADAADPG